MEYLQRFGLMHDVFPQNAAGRSFFEAPAYGRLKKRFELLAQRPGIGVLVGEVGVGKTSALRNLCASLPRPHYQVAYLCETAATPWELYRQLALELGVRPAHRRAQLWHDLRTTLTHLVDEESVQPVLILDDAHRLSEPLLSDLSGFLNFAMDSRSLLVVWLAAQPQLLALLRMKHHAALASRIAVRVQLPPLPTREDFLAFLSHGLKAAGATTKIVSDPATELLWRVSRGLPREAAHLLREALVRAHEEQRAMVDETLLEAVLDEEGR